MIGLALVLCFSGCTGYYGQTPAEFVKRSSKLREFKKKVKSEKSVQQLLELSYIDDCRIALDPDVEYSGLDKSKYKGSTLVIRLLSKTTERVFIALGIDQTLSDKKQKYNYKTPFLKKINAKINCYYISDSLGYAIYSDKNGLVECFENEKIPVEAVKKSD